MLASEYAARAEGERLQRVCRRFIESYGDGPLRCLRAPARVNVLGEHVDYVNYLPTASLAFASREHDMLMFLRLRDDGRIRGASERAGFDPFRFDIGEALAFAPAETWEDLLARAPVPSPHWSNYVRGAVFFARAKYGSAVVRGFDFLLDSSMPAQGGASSSSALTVLAGAAIRISNSIPWEPGEIAFDSARAEWYVGTRGGTLDHRTLCLSRMAHFIRLEYGSPRHEWIPVPPADVRWVTLFTHPADKGREVMFEYNERAAVSRIVIPAIIESWRTAAPSRYSDWTVARRRLDKGEAGATESLAAVLQEHLPAAVSFSEIRALSPAAYRRCESSFPALVRDRGERPLKIRDRALHHLGEVRRVSEATVALQWPPGESARRLGALLSEAHASLRDLYEVTTPEVEQMVRALSRDSAVLGSRLMGGGFGGNVLALMKATEVDRVLDRIQSEFYAPRGRDCRSEMSIMLSTPGDGLAGFDEESLARAAVSDLARRWREADRLRGPVCLALDALGGSGEFPEVWPVVVAAGSGTRAKQSGVDTPKPAAEVAGIPAVRRVLDAVLEGAPRRHKPVVLVSAETEDAVRLASEGLETCFVRQPSPLGTGNAVMHAEPWLRGYPGWVLVVWGTQPVLRAKTVRRAVALAGLFPECHIIIPTAVMERPYAPLLRDASGRVLDSRETRLGESPSADLGESNVGLFVVRAENLFRALAELHKKLWNEAESRYDRPRGEFGFPNEIIPLLAREGAGILAVPIADWREEKGLKVRDDIALCQQYIAELGSGE